MGSWLQRYESEAAGLSVDQALMVLAEVLLLGIQAIKFVRRNGGAEWSGTLKIITLMSQGKLFRFVHYMGDLGASMQEKSQKPNESYSLVELDQNQEPIGDLIKLVNLEDGRLDYSGLEQETAFALKKHCEAVLGLSNDFELDNVVAPLFDGVSLPPTLDGTYLVKRLAKTIRNGGLRSWLVLFLLQK